MLDRRTVLFMPRCALCRPKGRRYVCGLATLYAMSDITVVKVGGSTLGQHDSSLSDIAVLHAAGRKLVTVHGGGNAATEWLKIHGIASEFVDGLRVTGPDAIGVAVGV